MPCKTCGHLGSGPICPRCASEKEQKKEIQLRMLEIIKHRVLRELWNPSEDYNRVENAIENVKQEIINIDDYNG
jgi:hypothetical protein